MIRPWLLAAALVVVAACWLGFLLLACEESMTSMSRAVPAVVEKSGAVTPEATGRVRPPVARPVATPTRASRSDSRLDRLDWRGPRLDVTAYCPTGHRTASGAWPRPGMAAGNRWPFGTVLDVEGVGRVVVTDRIGHGSELDLYMPSCAAAIRFGRRHLRVVEVRP